jgi:16S rRNA (cytosine967-C5)-methyltransferase
LSARRAAAELLVAVENGRALDDALTQTPVYDALEGRDRAFARALATETLRWQGALDAVLAHFLQKPLPESAAHARALLRLGAVQILVMGTPAHAAVGETVETANAMGEARGFAKLMNAVLRRVSERGGAILADLPEGAHLPAWLFTRWRATYGERAAAIAMATLKEAPLDLSVKTDAAGWAEKLGGVVTPTGSVRLLPSSLAEKGSGDEGRPAAQAPARLNAPHPLTPSPQGRGGITTLAGFEDGAWWVQDAAAALPAKLLGDVAGKRVLDLCAAPGGKTLQLAAMGAHVTAVDKSAARLERLRENLARTKLEAEVIAADALTFRTDTLFDAILLDAPCTSTGTLRRHPDVAWLRRPTDVRALAELQGQMIDAAAALLKPEGRLVYAVCSLEPEEGPGVVAGALKRGWRRLPIDAEAFAGAGAFLNGEGDLRTLPAQWPKVGGLDGFFAARLVR